MQVDNLVVARDHNDFSRDVQVTSNVVCDRLADTMALITNQVVHVHVLVALMFVIDSREETTATESYFEEHRLIHSHVNEKVLH